MIHIIVCFIIMLVLHLMTPFWFWIMVVPFGYCALKVTTGWHGFSIGAISAGLLWLIGSLYYWLSAGEFIAQRVSVILKIGYPWVLVAITTIIAMLAGGFTGSSGQLLGKILHKKKQ